MGLETKLSQYRLQRRRLMGSWHLSNHALAFLPFGSIRRYDHVYREFCGLPD